MVSMHLMMKMNNNFKTHKIVKSHRRFNNKSIPTWGQADSQRTPYVVWTFLCHVVSSCLTSHILHHDCSTPPAPFTSLFYACTSCGRGDFLPPPHGPLRLLDAANGVILVMFLTSQPIRINTICKMFMESANRLGFKDTTVHAFRCIFVTLVNNSGVKNGGDTCVIAPFIGCSCSSPSL